MRTFKVDVLACPDCGERLKLVSLGRTHRCLRNGGLARRCLAASSRIKDPDVTRRICRHLGHPEHLPTPAPARPPPQLEMGDWG